MRSFRCLARSGPGSYSICCWNPPTGQRTRLGVVDLRAQLHLRRRQRGRPRCTRGAVADSGSPPLRIGSQTNQFYCSDIWSRLFKKTKERDHEGIGEYTYFAVLREIDLQCLRIVVETQGSHRKEDIFPVDRLALLFLALVRGYK